MGRRMLAFTLVAAVVGTGGLGNADAAPRPPTPEAVETLLTFDPDVDELPEGVAVDKRGQIYISFPFTGELRRLDPDGSQHLVATLPIGGGFGPLGLAVDPPGNVFVAVVTFDPATIASTGSALTGRPPGFRVARRSASRTASPSTTGATCTSPTR